MRGCKEYKMRIFFFATDAMDMDVNEHNRKNTLNKSILLLVILSTLPNVRKSLLCFI